ncbi:MAG: hypothetical protein IJ427_08805 [Lachnospiraceae bacterium]|nr:hypothetical protein [Lachnospiraceae bacterium]
MDDDKTGRKHRSSGCVHGETPRDEMRMDCRLENLAWEKQMSVLRSMFPLVSTKAALQEKHFVRGYACSCRIFAMENRDEWVSMKQYLELALEEYQRSYEETGTPEAVANHLWALCLGYTFAVDVETVGAESEAYTRDCCETGMLLINILREYEAYEALAEYYYRLLHVIGMDGNGAGVEFNKAV